jgi:hypothetical protein
MGADSDLFGRRVSRLPAAPASSMRVKLDDGDAYGSVNPTGAVVPAFVGGVVSGAPQNKLTLAVSINGVVQGVASTYSADGDTRFGAVVPAAAFRRGRNAVAVLAIEGAGKERRLSRLATQPLS